MAYEDADAELVKTARETAKKLDEYLVALSKRGVLVDVEIEKTEINATRHIFQTRISASRPL